MANETTRTCPGDCRKCNIYQHTYCASQMCQNSFPTLDTIVAKLDEIKAEIADMKAERDLTQPEMHRNGGGADNRPPIVEPKDDEL